MTALQPYSPGNGVSPTLIVQPELVAELRLGLVAELPTIAADLTAIMDHVEGSTCMRDAFVAMVPRLREATNVLRARHVLHQTVGLPGEPLRAEVLDGAAVCRLAAESLSAQRDRHIARLAAGQVRREERARVVESVRQLSSFLRDAEELARVG